MPSAIEALIATLVSTSVVITAIALILLSIYGRLSSCVRRIRFFDEHMQTLIEKRIKCQDKPRLNDYYSKNIRLIRSEVPSILGRAHVLRLAIIMFEVNGECIHLVFFMIVTGIFSILTVFNEVIFNTLALVAFVVGLVFMLVGVLLSIKEAMGALSTVETEYIRVIDFALDQGVIPEENNIPLLET